VRSGRKRLDSCTLAALPAAARSWLSSCCTTTSASPASAKENVPRLVKWMSAAMIPTPNTANPTRTSTIRRARSALSARMVRTRAS